MQNTFRGILTGAAILMGSWSVAHGAEVSVNYGTIFQDCADCPEMVVVPPGSFTTATRP